MKTAFLVNVKLASFVLLCAVLLAPSAVAVAEVAGTIGAQPIIELPETSQDGGVVEEGTVVSFRFAVTNRGQADLEVTQVKPSCGCTVTQWDRVIKPGAQGTIQAQMNTLSFRGSVTKHLTVFSNDPTRPQVELTISARTLPLVMISPGPAASVTVEDRPVTQEFTLERRGGKPMKIVQVIAYNPYIKAETTPLPGPGRYKLTVTAMPDAPLGRSNAAVVVWTDAPSAPSFTFILTVDRGIVTIPPMLFFGVVPHDVQAPRLASVTLQRNSTPFHVKSVAVDDPHLTTKLETVRAGAEYRVTLTYAGGLESGVRRQKLTVTTDDPKQPLIEIPVRAVVQAQIAHAPPAASH